MVSGHQSYICIYLPLNIIMLYYFKQLFNKIVLCKNNKFEITLDLSFFENVKCSKSDG